VTEQETLPLRTGRRILLGCLGEFPGQHKQAAREMETEFPPSTWFKKRYYVHSIHVTSCPLDNMAVKSTIQRGQRPTVVDNIFETQIFDGASEHLGQL
jgi:hypothetical protein